MVDVEQALRSIPATVPVEPLDSGGLADRVRVRRRRRRQRRTIGVIAVLLAVIGTGAVLARHRQGGPPTVQTVGPPAGRAACAPSDTTSTEPSQFVMTDTPQARRVVDAVRQQYDAALVHVDSSVLVMALCDNLAVSASSTSSTMTIDQLRDVPARGSTTPLPGLPDEMFGHIDRQSSTVVVEVLRIGDPSTLATVRIGDISQGIAPAVEIDDATVDRAASIATTIATIGLGDRRLPAYVPGGPPPDTTVLSSMLSGLSFDEAQQLAEGTGWVLRVQEQDGVGIGVRSDLRPNRIDVAVANGAITRVLEIS